MSSSPSKAEDEAPDKQQLCVDMLVNGNVQAYVDFFYLTHRPEQATGGPASQDSEAQASIPSKELPFVKSHLGEAEVSRRRGDTKAVYASYEELATFFGQLSDQRTAVYFWEKCAEIAKLTADAEGERAAIRALGMAHEAMHEVEAAVKQYEKLLALSSGDNAREKQASTHLNAAYASMAAAAAAGGDLRAALDYREQCLRSATVTKEGDLIMKAHYNLGQAHEKLYEKASLGELPGDAGDKAHVEAALSHYKPYLELSEAAQDIVEQGRACFALAHAYQQLGQYVESQAQLKRFLELSEATGEVTAQADACCSLGVLYNSQQDYTLSVEYLERFFQLACQIGDRALLDKARAYLSIAKGNLVLPAYSRVVTDDLDALLAWKNRRKNFV